MRKNVLGYTKILERMPWNGLARSYLSYTYYLLLWVCSWDHRKDGYKLVRPKG